MSNRGYYRHTKIIATLGPATESRERLEQLIRAGVDVIRLNMAHATGEWVATVIQRTREVSTELSRHIAIMMDVKEPEIRTGPVAEPIELKVGDLFEFYTETPTEGVTGVSSSINRPLLPLPMSMAYSFLEAKRNARWCCATPLARWNLSPFQ